MDAHKPQVGNGRAYHRAYILFLIKPIKEFFHFRLQPLGGRSDIMHFLSAKHTRYDMLLVGTVSAHFDVRAIAEACREERRLPCAQFFFGQRLVKVACRIQHDRHYRVYIMRRRRLLDVFDAQFTSYRRAHLVYVQADTLYLGRVDHIVGKVFSHSLQLAVEAQRGKPSVEQALLSADIFKYCREYRSVPSECRPFLSFVYVHKQRYYGCDDNP